MRKIILTSLFILSVIVSKSQDRVFTYTYQSLVLNQGQREIEVWNTLRSGREDFYRGLDTRIEFEIGIAKNLQTAFYINAKSSAAEHHEATDFGGDQVSIEKEMEWSFSNEWKYKLSDPVANGFGSALYAEISVAPTELELEAKIIIDKKIGNSLHALNIVAENEWETELEQESINEYKVEQESEFKFEFDYGFSYNLNPNWNIGLEVRNRNEIIDDEWNTSVLYAGPGFSYVKGAFWVNFTVLPQVAGLLTPNEESGLYLNGYEKFESRLIFSYAF